MMHDLREHIGIDMYNLLLQAYSRLTPANTRRRYFVRGLSREAGLGVGVGTLIMWGWFVGSAVQGTG